MLADFVSLKGKTIRQATLEWAYPGGDSSDKVLKLLFTDGTTWALDVPEGVGGTSHD